MIFDFRQCHVGCRRSNKQFISKKWVGPDPEKHMGSTRLIHTRGGWVGVVACSISVCRDALSLRSSLKPGRVTDAGVLTTGAVPAMKPEATAIRITARWPFDGRRFRVPKFRYTAQLMPLLLTISCFSKIQIGFTFLVPARPGSPGKVR